MSEGATVLGSEPTDRWEREVLRQARLQCPRDWTILTNVFWTIETDAGYVRDGQSDLVVLVPNLGMVIVEVKGSAGFFIGNDGCWYREARNGKVELVKEPPPAQATRNMHELARIVARKGNWPAFPGSYAYIVAYPNGEASRLPEMFDASTLLTRRQMGQFASRVRLALERRGDSGSGNRFTHEVAKRVAELLTNRPFAINRVDTSLDAADDSGKIDALTAQQFAALRGLFEFDRVGISGPAGSGKTLLAIWRLRALLAAGVRALYTCYNKDLAAYLRMTYPDCASSVVHVDKLFWDLCDASVALPRNTSGPAFFHSELPQLVLDIASRLSAEQKYEAILVDEAQDFGEERQIALLDLLRAPSSQWMLFSDSSQDLYKIGSAALKSTDATFRLHCNCRNTRETTTATNRILRMRVEAMPGVPAGVAPLVEILASRSQIATRAMELAKLYTSEGSVVILSPLRFENSCMSAMRQAYGLTLSHSIGDLGKRGMAYFSTIRSFKGIEASIVIVVDIDAEASHPIYGPQDLYVAYTRPTSRLVILTVNTDFGNLLRERLA